MWPEGPVVDWTGEPGVAILLVEGRGALVWPEGSGIDGMGGPGVAEGLGVAAAVSKSCSMSVSQESIRWNGATDGLPPRTASIWL